MNGLYVFKRKVFYNIFNFVFVTAFVIIVFCIAYYR